MMKGDDGENDNAVEVGAAGPQHEKITSERRPTSSNDHNTTTSKSKPPKSKKPKKSVFPTPDDDFDCLEDDDAYLRASDDSDGSSDDDVDLKKKKNIGSLDDDVDAALDDELNGLKHFWIALLAVCIGVTAAMFVFDLKRNSTHLKGSNGDTDDLLFGDDFFSDPFMSAPQSSATSNNNRNPPSNIGIISEEDETGSSLPALSSLISGSNDQITGNVQFLLDFAIVGHTQTLTGSLVHWLTQHSQISMHNRELHSLKQNRPADLVRSMYELATSEDTGDRETSRISGYRATNEICYRQSLKWLHKYWPKTKLIVGLHHPVWWFQDWYNRMAESKQEPIMSIGKQHIPYKARFHVHLASLGKTLVSSYHSATAFVQEQPPMFDARQQELLNWHFAAQHRPLRMSNSIFLYDRAQLEDANETRREEFRSSLSEFLGLETLLDEPPPAIAMAERHHEEHLVAAAETEFASASSSSNDRDHDSKRAANLGTAAEEVLAEAASAVAYGPEAVTGTAESFAEAESRFNICNDEYKILRLELVALGTNASTWILDYFAPHPDVTATSNFAQLLELWKQDPCESGREGPPAD